MYNFLLLNILDYEKNNGNKTNPVFEKKVDIKIIKLIMSFSNFII